MLTKVCKNCHIEKPLDSFYKHKSCKDGYLYTCKICYNNKSSVYYEKNKKQIQQYKKGYAIKNKLKIKNYRKKYYFENKDIELEKQKQYNIKNKEAICLKKKIKYQSDGFKERRNEYLRLKRQNISERIRHALSNRIGNVLRESKLIKANTTVKYIGCSALELKKHIESLFVNEMSWDNYGTHGWHIDHILPCSLFDLRNSEEREVCFHYTNLRPLWAKDNIKKGKSLIGD